MKKIIFISLPIILILIIIVLIVVLKKKPKIHYYKCPEKDNSELLNKVLSSNNISKNNSNFDLYMPCGYNYVESELSKINTPNSQFIFALQGCDEIVSKNGLWQHLQNTYGHHTASTIMPESFIISNPNDFHQAMQLVNNNVLICKKNIQRKLGLKFAFNQKDLLDAKKDNFKVAQKFLQNTLQIKERKINLRIYYVITKHKNNLQFFINKNGKILYTKEKTSNNINFETHITSFQMDPNLYQKENLPHNLNELKKYLGKPNFNLLWSKIIQKIKLLSLTIFPIFHNSKYFHKTCFQLFGMDIIIDNNEPYILEINKGPDMIPKCDKDIKLKESIYEETFNLVGLIPFYIKKNNFIKIL